MKYRTLGSHDGGLKVFAIDATAPNGGTAGPRYDERGMRMVKL